MASSERIANDFQIEEARYIRRHARALGLYARRRDNYLFTLENLLERSDEIELTAAAYIKAVRAYACMCDTVRWTEPAIRVIGLRDSSNKQADGASLASLLPQAASENSASSALESDVVARASSLPKAAFNNPARSAPPRADGAPCGSGLQPRRKMHLDHVSASERLEGRGSSSTSPRASAVAGAVEAPQPAVDVSARSAVSFARDTGHESRDTSTFSSLPEAASENSASSALESDVVARLSSLPKAAFNNPATAKPAPSPNRRIRPTNKQSDVASSASLLPQAALKQPAAAEQTPPSGQSGAARSQKSVATSASSLPPARRGGEAALDNPATAKPSPATHNTPHFQGTASAARLTGVEAGASAPKGSAPAPLPASQLEELTLSGVEGQAPSNRPSPRLETGVSDTKQRKEVRSNRP